MKIFEMVGEVAINAKKAEGQLKDLDKKGKRTSERLSKNFKKAGAQLGTFIKRGAQVGALAIGAFATSSIQQFVKFDEKMREVYTLLPGLSEEMRDELSEDVRAVGEQYGFLADDTVPALYQAISAGVPPGNVMDFMETAAKSAKAGVTDLQTSVDGLTSAVNAYGSEVLSVQEASDTMFTAVRLGKTTYAELAAGMSNVTPIASALGVSFEDINAALATMTAQGMDTQKSTVFLRALLNDLSKEGSAANDVFKEMANVTFTEYIAQGNSLADALSLMEDFASKNNVTMKQLFANVRAGTAALQLTGGNMDKFNSNMDEMGEKAGSTEAAYLEMSESIQQTLDELRAWWQNQRIAIGEDLEDSLRELLEFLQENQDTISNLIESIFTKLVDSLKWIANNGGEAVEVLKAVGAAIVAWKIGAAVSGLWGLVFVLGVLGGLGVAKAIREIGEAMQESWGKDAIDRHTDNIDSLEGAIKDHKETLADYEEGLAELEEQRKGFEEGEVPGWLDQAIASMKENIKIQKDLIAQYEDWREAEEYAKKAAEDTTAAGFELDEQLTEQAQRQKEVTKETIASVEAQLAYLRTIRATADKVTPRLNEKISALSDKLQEMKESAKRAEETTGGLTEAQRRERIMIEGVTTAREDQTEADEAQVEETGNLKQVLQDYIREQELSNRVTKVSTELTNRLSRGYANTAVALGGYIEEEKSLKQILQETEEGEEGVNEQLRKRLSFMKTFTERERSLKQIIQDEPEIQESINERLSKRLGFGQELTEQTVSLKKALRNKIKTDKGINEQLERRLGFGQELTEQHVSLKRILQDRGDVEEDVETQIERRLDRGQQLVEREKSLRQVLRNLNREQKQGNKVSQVSEKMMNRLGRGYEQTKDALGGLVKGTERYNEVLRGLGLLTEGGKKFAQTIESGIASALTADTYVDFVAGFGASIESALKNAIINAFLASEAIKPQITKLANMMSEYVAEGSEGGMGGILLSSGEKADIQNLVTRLRNSLVPLYDALNTIQFFDVETKTSEGPTSRAVGSTQPRTGGISIDTSVFADMRSGINTVNTSVREVASKIETVNATIQQQEPGVVNLSLRGVVTLDDVLRAVTREWNDELLGRGIR